MRLWPFSRRQASEVKSLANPSDELLALFGAAPSTAIRVSTDQALRVPAVSAAIRTIADDLGGLDRQAWATTAYLITSTIATPIYGKLSDLYGRKPFFMVAITIFTFGIVTKMLYESIETIDMGRRGIHNEGSRILLERLDGKVETDMATARRLFTLICVLHFKG